MDLLEFQNAGRLDAGSFCVDIFDIIDQSAAKCLEVFAVSVFQSIGESFLYLDRAAMHLCTWEISHVINKEISQS